MSKGSLRFRTLGLTALAGVGALSLSGTPATAATATALTVGMTLWGIMALMIIGATAAVTLIELAMTAFRRIAISSPTTIRSRRRASGSESKMAPAHYG